MLPPLDVLELIPRHDDAIVVSMAFVYILRCDDGSLYVGRTDNLDERKRAHDAGEASRYTAERLPVHVVLVEEYESIQLAITRERQIKRWSQAKKEALITGDYDALHDLSLRQT